MDLLLATRNAHKTRELAELLGCEIHDVTSRADLPMIEETGVTFVENAALKAVAISKHVPELVLGDDSGLEVEALNGAPGVLSARYAGANSMDAENVAKLLRELRGKTPARARFRCVITVAQHGELIRTFDGVVEGQIIDTARGAHGFGYDPVFVPDGFSETFAELPLEVKNKVSHRARAVAQVRDFLMQRR